MNCSTHFDNSQVYAWMIYTRHIPHQGGRRWKYAQDLRMWNQMRDYFPVHLHKTCNLDTQHNYVFGVHPHGALVVGAFMNFCTEATDFSKAFSGIRPFVLGLDCFFNWPIISDYIMLIGKY